MFGAVRIKSVSINSSVNYIGTVGIPVDGQANPQTFDILDVFETSSLQYAYDASGLAIAGSGVMPLSKRWGEEAKDNGVVSPFYNRGILTGKITDEESPYNGQYIYSSDGKTWWLQQLAPSASQSDPIDVSNLAKALFNLDQRGQTRTEYAAVTSELTSSDFAQYYIRDAEGNYQKALAYSNSVTFYAALVLAETQPTTQAEFEAGNYYKLDGGKYQRYTRATPTQSEVETGNYYILVDGVYTLTHTYKASATYYELKFDPNATYYMAPDQASPVPTEADFQVYYKLVDGQIQQATEYVAGTTYYTLSYPYARMETPPSEADFETYYVVNSDGNLQQATIYDKNLTYYSEPTQAAPTETEFKNGTYYVLAVNGIYQKVDTYVEAIPAVTKDTFVANTYYVRDSEGNYTLATKYDKNVETYYR